MTGEEIRFTMDKKGKIAKIESSNFQGVKCMEELQRLQAHMKSIGVTVNVVDQVKKNELYSTETSSQNTKTY